MAKPLKDILAGAKTSKTAPGVTGAIAGVDYMPKAGDEADFVAKHATEKHDYRDGNDEDIAGSKKMKQAILKPAEEKHRPIKGTYEEADIKESVYHVSWGVGLDHQVKAKHADDAVSKAKEALTTKIPKLKHPKYADTFNKKPVVHNISKRVSEETEDLDETRMGFKKLARSLAHKKGVRNPGALAAAIGRKKYGKEKFQKAAAIDHAVKECDMDGDYSEPKTKKNGRKLLLGDKKKISEEWAVKHADGSVTKHKNAQDALRAEKKSPGAKVFATHGAGGSKASHVLGDPRDRELPLFKTKNEETKLDELSKDTLANYIPKAAHSIGLMTAKRVNKGITHPDYEKSLDKHVKRQQGIQRAVDKLTNEEVLDEAKKGISKLHVNALVGAAVHDALEMKDALHKDVMAKHNERHKALKEEYGELFEVLSKSDPTSKWIHDFVHSKDPKFAGKSTKERQRMALGAYYAKQRNEDLAVPLLGSVSGSKKTKKCKSAKEQMDTPMTFPNLSVDVNTGRNV